MTAICPFDVAWRGACNAPATSRGYCDHHAAKSCGLPDCNEQAIAECNQTMQFVCGVPLCAEHRTAFHGGHNGC